MFAFAILLSWVVVAANGPHGNHDRPNIVVFLVDDMGVMDTSVPFLTDGEGKPKRYPLNEYFRTPNMEQLARNGVRFNTFYSMSVCSPTRTSLMTGQNSARHHVTNWIRPDANNRGSKGPPDWKWSGLSPTDVALPRLLQATGYRTIHIGKGHFGPTNTLAADPQNLGFDVNVAGSSIGHPASYYGKNSFGNIQQKNGKRSLHAVPGLERYHNSSIFLTDALTEEAKANVSDSVRRGTPFFLYLAHYAVHSPFQADPRFEKNYKDSGKSPQARAYASLIEGMDQSLGDLMEHLQKLGIAEETIVFFVGDNGSDAPLGPEHAVACAAPLRGKKGTHYEGGMRAPFIASWAKPNAEHPLQRKYPVVQGAIRSEMAAVYDLFPTILTLARTAVPTGHVLDGQSLLPLLAGKQDFTRKREFLMHYPHSHRTEYFTTYRRGDWKVIYHYFPSKVSEDSHYQLFDLKADPFESTNLASSRRDVLREMVMAMTKQLESQRAQFPVSDDGKTPQKPVIPLQ
jgi:arylsulfatase A-like enzyme